MSRAFMKEAEPGEPRCPACDALGEPVGGPTLDALAPKDKRSMLGASAFWCGSADCAVGWFTAWGESVPAGKVYPKDPSAPICPCTGLTAPDVVADATSGRKDRMKALRELAEGPASRCGTTCPDGKPCVARVFRLYRETVEAISGRGSPSTGT